MERREPSCTVGRLENNMAVPQKIKIDLPYDLAISLLGIYQMKTKKLIQKDMCVPMSIKWVRK